MSENSAQQSIGTMLRLTGANTAQFMEQVAIHFEKLEQEVVRLQQRVQEMESNNDDSK